MGGAAAQISNHLNQVDEILASDAKGKLQRHLGCPVINLVSDPDCNTEFITEKKNILVLDYVYPHQDKPQIPYFLVAHNHES